MLSTDAVLKALHSAQKAKPNPLENEALERPNDKNAWLLIDTSSNKNLCRLYCPNPSCRCVILFENSCKVHSGSPVTRLPELESLTALPEGKVWMSVANAFEFANIAFSKKVMTPESGLVQYLCCPDCEVGPLGLAKATEDCKDGEYKPGECLILLSRLRANISALNRDQVVRR